VLSHAVLLSISTREVFALPATGGTGNVAFAEDGLKRLRIGLAQAGLDPRYFPWPPEGDPERPPYRGLRPLEAEDAGIFFGRDGAIVAGLDLLRGLRDAEPPRLLVILGASGAGKSSFGRGAAAAPAARRSPFRDAARDPAGARGAHRRSRPDRRTRACAEGRWRPTQPCRHPGCSRERSERHRAPACRAGAAQTARQRYRKAAHDYYPDRPS
jgi:conflict system STAND superfamily ATPase